MNKYLGRTLLVTAIIASLALAACKKQESAPVATTPAPTAVETPTPAESAMPAAVSVTSVDLGNAVGVDMKVIAPTSTFGVKDNIYAAVSTDGSAPGSTKLGAKWTYQTGDIVKEDAQDLALNGPAVTDFMISKPGGWPVGNYKVEISLNGAVVQSKDFQVK